MLINGISLCVKRKLVFKVIKKVKVSFVKVIIVSV